MWIVTLSFQEKPTVRKEQVAHWMSQYGQTGFDYIPTEDDLAGAMVELWVVCPSEELEKLQQSLRKHILSEDIYTYSVRLWQWEPFDKALMAQ